MTYIQAVILAIVEGLTEFLPISSTGHMVFTASAMGIEKDAFTKLFIEAIQFGAIISVVVLYWRKFLDFKKWKFYVKLLIAIIPAVVVGVLLKKHIDSTLGNPLFIAIVTLIGGIILLFVDNWFKKPAIDDVDKVSPKRALFIGLFQVLAIVFPGLSRSAATIVGGMQQKLTRKVAAEFSFFLAVPTMFAATVFKLFKLYKVTPGIFSHDTIVTLLIGNAVAFVVAMLAIKIFITYLTKHGFKLFGYYRIIVGLTILILLYFHVNLNFA